MLTFDIEARDPSTAARAGTLKLPHGEGRVVTEPVGLIDVTPTILDVLGLEAAPELAGRSLFEPRDTSHPVFAETSRQANLRSVQQGSLKLVSNLGRRAIELYDLAEDPGETRDVSHRRPADVQRLRGSLQAWGALVERRMPTAAPVELSDEERQRLESLGYGE